MPVGRGAASVIREQSGPLFDCLRGSNERVGGARLGGPTQTLRGRVQCRLHGSSRKQVRIATTVGGVDQGYGYTVKPASWKSLSNANADWILSSRIRTKLVQSVKLQE